MLSRYKLKTKALNFILSEFGDLRYLGNKDWKLISPISNIRGPWCFYSSVASKSKFSSIQMKR